MSDLCTSLNNKIIYYLLIVHCVTEREWQKNFQAPKAHFNSRESRKAWGKHEMSPTCFSLQNIVLAPTSFFSLPARWNYYMRGPQNSNWYFYKGKWRRKNHGKTERLLLIWQTKKFIVIFSYLSLSGYYRKLSVCVGEMARRLGSVYAWLIYMSIDHTAQDKSHLYVWNFCIRIGIWNPSINQFRGFDRSLDRLTFSCYFHLRHPLPQNLLLGVFTNTNFWRTLK